MAAYDIKITGTEGEIVFDQETDVEGNSILEVKFKMNTLDDKTVNRAGAVRCEFTIKGKITAKNKAETGKLAQWSMLGSGDGLYRKVVVTVYTDDSRNEVLRQYEADKMFCIDYEESFSEKKENNDNDESGIFTLYIAQKEGRHSKDVFSN